MLHPATEEHELPSSVETVHIGALSTLFDGRFQVRSYSLIRIQNKDPFGRNRKILQAPVTFFGPSAIVVELINSRTTLFCNFACPIGTVRINNEYLFGPTYAVDRRSNIFFFVTDSYENGDIAFLSRIGVIPCSGSDW